MSKGFTYPNDDFLSQTLECEWFAIHISLSMVTKLSITLGSL